MKICVVGDFHYPSRSDSLKLLKELEGENPELIIGTGDYTIREVIERLERIAKFTGVRGNVDSEEIELPDFLELEIKGWKIIVFHSNKIYPRGDVGKIYEKWRERKPDVIIFGHTHVPFFSSLCCADAHPTYFLNPGSFNGVASGEHAKGMPSFAVLEVEENEISVKFINKREKI